ncbi:hypothetical protein ZIOFF_042309 [Zingiber officinale]|uniref:NB-ARC domain-containing protein n=1 Tax=Zingiber officinale TaxID=94328 RepID=A0A8J5G8X7_ZINOF|nr:hypothetical protein ZIOFF_042309 [Zingiber officinale]
MGGVGKTALLEEIRRKVKEAEMFDLVIDVVVSQNPNIAQIQRDVADALGMSESSNKMLVTRLKQEKKVLIMLDDVWAQLELVKEVGIPYQEHNGCKVILTSRSAELCNLMETDVSVEVATLSEEDSWQLFRMRAGQVLESDDIEVVARKVAQECCGLPLAIVVVGRALRSYKDSRYWEEALSQLKQSVPSNIGNVEEKLYKSLELSYQNLKSSELKQLFLYCCLFHKDYDISEEEVTRYAVGENLLSNISTLEEARGRVHFLLETLKLSCLLLDSKKPRCVRLHGVVRDVAVYIGSKYDNHFLVKAGLHLRYWRERENFAAWDRISLMNNDLQEIPENPNCSKLVLLLLNMNPITSLPTNFFENMVTLNVLDLSDTYITCLPLSSACLKKLGTLRLDRCKWLNDINVVGELKTLIILSLRECIQISALPENIVALVKLKLLDLSYCTSLPIPRNLIPKLTRLEELYFRGCNVTEALFIETLDTIHSRLLPSDTFKKLKQLKIMGCPCLKHVFLPSIANEFQSLEKLEMKNNGSIETIITDKEVCDLKKGAFPMLQQLLLIKLPRLGCFFIGEPAKTLDWPSLEYIHLSDCSNLARLPIGRESAQKLKKLHVASLNDVIWFKTLKWKDNTTKSRFDIM